MIKAVWVLGILQTGHDVHRYLMPPSSSSTLRQKDTSTLFWGSQQPSRSWALMCSRPRRPTAIQSRAAANGAMAPAPWPLFSTFSLSPGQVSSATGATCATVWLCGALHHHLNHHLGQACLEETPCVSCLKRCQGLTYLAAASASFACLQQQHLLHPGQLRLLCKLV